MLVDVGIAVEHVDSLRTEARQLVDVAAIMIESQFIAGSLTRLRSEQLLRQSSFGEVMLKSISPLGILGMRRPVVKGAIRMRDESDPAFQVHLVLRRTCSRDTSLAVNLF